MTVLDADDDKILTERTLGVFVVPLGVEREMDIHSEETQR
jgi:hypothetical protein